MSREKPGIPKGTRDFLPREMTGRKYIFNTIENVFRQYGYLPIETPSMENLSTLLGKYGEEGDKLLFKILNSGDFLSEVPDAALQKRDVARVASVICEKGLRYDLTVPFARFVVQHRSEIEFPFKRYQIQPVWRADRPQKGRYREFYQCDVDVIGSNSLLNEAELFHIIDRVFMHLGVDVIIRFNNRKVLAGLAEVMGEGSRFIQLTMAIDKLEKAGMDAVMADLTTRGFGSDGLGLLRRILELKGSNDDKIKAMQMILNSSETGLRGLAETSLLLEYASGMEWNATLEFDVSLARGLDYYTGAIIEVKARNAEMGSICGGGRYDDLTGIFGLEGVSGVGVSFGADRIYDVMEQLSLFPEENPYTTQLMFANFGAKEERYCLSLVNQVRAAGISAFLYPDPDKIKKQLSYANNLNIPYVALAGEDEMKNGTLTLKNMHSGVQQSLNVEEVIKLLK